jgi:hypothetical protein
LDTPTVLGTGIRMKISQFFASTSKHWLSPVHLPVTVRSKIPDTNICMNFDLFLKMLDGRSKQTFYVVFKIQFFHFRFLLPASTRWLRQNIHLSRPLHHQWQYLNNQITIL